MAMAFVIASHHSLCEVDQMCCLLLRLVANHLSVSTSSAPSATATICLSLLRVELRLWWWRHAESRRTAVLAHLTEPSWTALESIHTHALHLHLQLHWRGMVSHSAAGSTRLRRKGLRTVVRHAVHRVYRREPG